MNEPPVLSRSLRARHVAMISIGGIIGAGLFVGSSAAIAATGPAVIVSYLIAGLLIFLSMRMLGELALANPDVGFFTDYARKILGHGWGFVAGWLYWYFWMIVVAVEALAGAILVNQWIAAPVWLIGLLLLACLTIVNLFSARSYGEFEFWFSSIKVAAILAFIGVTGAYVFGILADAGPDFANLTRYGGFAPFGGVSALAGVATVIFSLTGAEITTVAAAESREPVRAVAGMTTTLTFRVLLFYVVSMVLILCAVPWTSIVPGTSPFVAALTRVGIPGAAQVMNIVVLTAVLSCLNSGLYVTSRVLFALAANGDAPQSLVGLTRRKVPARAILTGTAFGYAALVVSVVSPTGVFAFLVNASGAAMLLLYLMIGAAEIRARSAMTRAEVDQLRLKMWFFPWLSYATEAGILAVLIAMTFRRDLASQIYTTLGFAVLLWLIYFGFRRANNCPVELPGERSR